MILLTVDEIILLQEKLIELAVATASGKNKYNEILRFVNTHKQK